MYGGGMYGGGMYGGGMYGGGLYGRNQIQPQTQDGAAVDPNVQ